MVEVEVSDPGPARRPVDGADAGRGVPGMRERVALCGGSLTVGQRADGSFHVAASLPAVPM
jgi:signal transduction histidine kinase